jgi:hypothetical protein
MAPPAAREKPLIRDLAGGFTPGPVDVEAGYGRDAIPAVAERTERFGQSKAKGADDPNRDNRDSSTCYGLAVKYHPLHPFSCTRFLLLSQPKHFSNGPKPKTKSLEVGGLSVEFIQRRFEIR